MPSYRRRSLKGYPEAAPSKQGFPGEATGRNSRFSSLLHNRGYPERGASQPHAGRQSISRRRRFFATPRGSSGRFAGFGFLGGAPVADATGVEKKPAPSSTQRRIRNGLSDSLLTLGRITGAAEWPGRFWLHRRPVRRDHFARLTQINSASLRMKTHLCAYAG